MRLVQADVLNFRSVKEATVTFEPRCRVLVGINESGKSNILKALRLLDVAVSPNRADDVREGLPTEAKVNEAYVRFRFRMDKADCDRLVAAVSTKIVSAVDDPQIAKIGSNRLGLRKLCALFSEVWFTVDIIKQTKSLSIQEPSAGVALHGAWSKPSPTCPPEFNIAVDTGTVALKGLVAIRGADVPGIPEVHLELARIEDIVALVIGETRKVAEAALPGVVYWEYRDEFLLPAKVSMDAFAADPRSCEPLWNMFILANCFEVKEELERVRQESSNQMQNFLNRIAAKTTQHFRGIWKDYKDIEFSLRHESGSIVPAIKEKNSFDFAKRSDGFKRFVSFLLLISADVRLGNLENVLLLIDEPDVSLHPSGARYLRDELIRIGATNDVVFSTHSIFMVDADRIDRHYLVAKKGEITTIETAEESNVTDEEVLYNALGFSMFEMLRARNIVFEGWKDKRLFETALASTSATQRRAFRDIGRCHARGAKNIRTITPMIELARRSCVIISDSDNAAIEQKRVYEAERGFGKWMTYQDLDPSLQAVTGEDFIKSGHIARHFNAAISELALPKLEPTEIPNDKGKLKALDNWLRNHGLGGPQVKEIVAQVKNAVFDDLKSQHIEDEYAKMLTALANT